MHLETHAFEALQKAESAGLRNIKGIDTSGELKISANFYLEREYSGTLIHDNENIEKGKVLNFRKKV
jgi:hypothetical protein